MKPIDMLKLAAMSLWRRKMRTALTILGVIIGTACIIVMVALGLGSMEQFNKTIAGSATLTMIQVYNGAGRGNGAAAKIDDKAIAGFRLLAGAKTVAPIIQIPVYIKVGRYEAQYAQLTGIDPAATPGFRFDKGALFSQSAGVPEIVLGSNTLLYFYDPADSEGGIKGMKSARGKGGEAAQPTGPDIDWLKAQAKVYLGGKQYAELTGDSPKSKAYRGGFAGVLKADQSEQSYNMYISLDMAKTMIKENLRVSQELGLSLNSYTSALVYAKDLDTVMPLLNAIKGMGYEAYSPTEYIESARTEQARQQSQLSMMAVISLLVSAIGIANTMMAGIMERKREIGVMKVVGLSINRIRLVFLTEAAVIGMLGGITGLLMSLVISLIVGGGTGQAMVLGMQFESGVKLIIPWWLALGAIGISVAVGMVSGIYPAVKATRMSPLEAIRGG